MKEKWKDVKGYEDCYQVSNLGRIRSKKRFITGRFGEILLKGKNLIPVPDKNGYNIVTLCKNGKQKIGKIHRLVAEAFIPNPNNLPQVNHKDEKKNNNCVENLEWCTSKYNSNYGTCKERRGKSMARAVLQYTLDGLFLAKYNSVSEAKRKVKKMHIYDCCNGKLKTCGGYIWRYENE